MRAVVQRVKRADVTIDGKVNGKIDQGLLVFLGVGENDTEEDLNYMVKKISGLRIFEDADEKMNLSVTDIGGSILLISQFTLYGDTKKGFRPSFIAAARPEKAIPLYEKCISLLREIVPTECGIFGADMQVSLVNDGPVTILIDSEKTF